MESLLISLVMYNRYNDYAKLMSGELWEIVENEGKK